MQSKSHIVEQINSIFTSQNTVGTTKHFNNTLVKIENNNTVSILKYNKMKASTFFSFLGGAAVGAALALLLAPEDGPSTRKKLKRKLKKYGVDLNNDELSELIAKFVGQKKAKADTE